MTPDDSLFRRLLALCERRALPVPEIAAFHAADDAGAPCVGLFAPPGTSAAALAAHLRSHDGIRCCAIPCNSTNACLDGQRPLERVALALVVTPADAALGMIETELMRRLSSRGRAFAVIIDGLDAMDEAARRGFTGEIELYKLAPLRDELGSFAVFLETADCTPLRDWIGRHVETEQQRQIALVAADWLAAIRAYVAGRAAGDAKRSAHLNHVDRHLEALVDFLSHDVLPRPIEGHVIEFLRFYADVVGAVDWPRDGGVAAFQRVVAEQIAEERAKLIWREVAAEVEALAERAP